MIFLVNGGWGEWSEWTPCTQSCDGGTTSRNRTCDSPEPSDDGEECQGAGVEMKVCNDHQCPGEWNVSGRWNYSYTQKGTLNERLFRSELGCFFMFQFCSFETESLWKMYTLKCQIKILHCSFFLQFAGDWEDLTKDPWNAARLRTTTTYRVPSAAPKDTASAGLCFRSTAAGKILPISGRINRLTTPDVSCQHAQVRQQA